MLSDFDKNYATEIVFERGYWAGGARDPNPTLNGVTQKTYDAFRGKGNEQPVRLMTPAEQRAIYLAIYKSTDRDVLQWPMDLLLFDCAVNSGKTRALTTLERGDTPATFLAERERFYRALAVKKPELGPNLKGWVNRVNTLRHICGVDI